MLHFRTFSWDDLSKDQLYRMLQLRQEVFVVEQDCPYLDLDDKDQTSYHVLGSNDRGEIHACTRIVPAGISYDQYCSIGRVVTSEQTRGIGAGKRLMHYSIDICKEKFPETSIKISAQCYLLGFYESLGFVPVGEEYLEDDIPHHAMVLEV